MPGFDAAVTREAGRGDVGGQGRRGQRGGTRDDPVQDDRDAQRGGAQDEPGQGGVLEAAERGQDAHRVGRVGAVQGQAAADDVDLPGVGGSVDPGAAAGRLGRVGAGEGADQRGRRGGVGDPHVAGDQAPVARGDQVSGDLQADRQRGHGLLAGHRRPGGEVRRARRDLAGQQSRHRLQRGGHPDVNHRDLGAGLGRERVDHRPAGQEVGHHLGRHLLRPGRHALGVHAVVGSEDRHAGRLGQRRGRGAGQAGQSHGHLFEHAQRAARLGHPVLPFARGGHRRRVGRDDRGDHVGERIHWFLPWQPAAAELLSVHRPRHRPAARPPGRGEFRFGRELGHVAQAKIGDHLQVRGQPELRGQLTLVEEAHPANAEAFGPGGQPQVGHREHAGEIRGLGLDMAAERVPSAAGAIAGDHDVDRGVQDRGDLQPVERAGPRAGQAGGELVAVPARQGGDLLPPGPVGDHDEVPGLGETHRRCLVGGREQPAEHVGGHRVGPEAPPDVPALRDHPVHGLPLLVRVAVLAWVVAGVRHEVPPRGPWPGGAGPRRRRRRPSDRPSRCGCSGRPGRCGAARPWPPPRRRIRPARR